MSCETTTILHQYAQPCCISCEPLCIHVFVTLSDMGGIVSWFIDNGVADTEPVHHCTLSVLCLLYPGPFGEPELFQCPIICCVHHLNYTGMTSFKTSQDLFLFPLVTKIKFKYFIIIIIITC